VLDFLGNIVSSLFLSGYFIEDDASM
jgi:hypothetical protein